MKSISFFLQNIKRVLLLYAQRWSLKYIFHIVCTACLVHHNSMNYVRLNNCLNHILYFLDEKDKQWNCISCYMLVTKIGSIFQLLEHLYCKKGPFTFSKRGMLRLDAYHSKNMYIMSFYHLFLFPPNNNLKQQATTDQPTLSYIDQLYLAWNVICMCLIHLSRNTFFHMKSSYLFLSQEICSNWYALKIPNYQYYKAITDIGCHLLYTRLSKFPY